MNHAVALTRQMEHLWVAASEVDELVKQGFGAGDLKPRTQRAAGVHESHEVLRVFAHRLVKHLQCVIEPVHGPERARLPQFRHIDTEFLKRRLSFGLWHDSNLETMKPLA